MLWINNLAVKCNTFECFTKQPLDVNKWLWLSGLKHAEEKGLQRVFTSLSPPTQQARWLLGDHAGSEPSKKSHTGMWSHTESYRHDFHRLHRLSLIQSSSFLCCILLWLCWAYRHILSAKSKKALWQLSFMLPTVKIKCPVCLPTVWRNYRVGTKKDFYMYCFPKLPLLHTGGASQQASPAITPVSFNILLKLDIYKCCLKMHIIHWTLNQNKTFLF